MKSNKSEIGINKILEVLPHRQPFLLIDRVLEHKVNESGPRTGQSVKVIKNVTYNEPFFSGHFPHNPVMPGVLILESMAQAAAFSCWRESDPLMNVAIARLSEARFRRPVVPGDQLLIEAEVVKDKKTMFLFKAKCSVDGELVTEVEMLAHVIPRDEVHA